jgi:hypothetical protein
MTPKGRTDVPDPKHSTSIYEPQALLSFRSSGGTVYEQPDVEIDDGEDGAAPAPVEPQQATARATPRFGLRKRSARGVPPEALEPAQPIGFVDVTNPVRNQGWTIDEAAPAPVPQPRRKVRVIENPVAPQPTRKVTVTITNFGPASMEERAWVVGGDTGVRLVVPGDAMTGKRPRLVAVYMAFQVTDVQENEFGDRTVTGIVRWHGLPADREGTWGGKLKRDGAERENQLIAALEYFFAFPEVCEGMAVQFLAAPATNVQTMRLNRYLFCSGKEGDPAIKVLVNMVGAEAPYKTAAAFYRDTNPFWLPNFLKLGWPFVSVEAIQCYWLGREVVKSGIPQLADDDLTAVGRVGMLGHTAELAEKPMGSLFKVALAGDTEVEAAVSLRGLVLPGRTMIGTVWEDEVE